MKKPLLFFVSLMGLCSHFSAHAETRFLNFTYQGSDEIFSRPLAKSHYQNPILAGFYPDPSVVRVDNTYYLANSSFSYYPGVPIHKSQDLVHWEFVGHALNRPSQLMLKEQQISRGIYAPTLRFHQGTFYLITTQVDGVGNFIVTTQDPAKGWSEPIRLPEVGGIDPDIFFDDDGKVYITHNDSPAGTPLYSGHRAIWMWEYDPNAQKVIPESKKLLVNGGTDISQKPVWIEGPHLYKINGWYYLMCAQGGTSEEHSEVIFRARSLKDPFIAFTGNPILSQKNLPENRADMVTSSGHADLVQTPNGDWYAVFLATRPYENTFYNTGRETFLLPVTWHDGWPMLLDQNQPVPLQVNAPHLLNTQTNKFQYATTGNFRWEDNFSGDQLKPEWNFINTPEALPWYKLEKNGIILSVSKNALSSLQQPHFIGRRQQHMRFQAATKLHPPTQPQESAGIAAFQNEKANYYFAITKQNQQMQIFVEQCQKTGCSPLIRKTLPNFKQITLGIEGNQGQLTFTYQIDQKTAVSLLKNADGKLLSTQVAGGFVGTYLGIHTRVETN